MFLGTFFVVVTTFRDGFGHTHPNNIICVAIFEKKSVDAVQLLEQFELEGIQTEPNAREFQ